MFTSLCYNVPITLWVFSVPHMRKTSPLRSPNTGPGAVKMSRIQVPFGPFVRIRFHCRKQKSLQRYYSGNGLTHRVDTYTLGGRNGVQARPPWNTPWTLQISLTRKLLPLRPLKLALHCPYNCRLGITKLPWKPAPGEIPPPHAGTLLINWTEVGLCCSVSFKS